MRRCVHKTPQRIESNGTRIDEVSYRNSENEAFLVVRLLKFSSWSRRQENMNPIPYMKRISPGNIGKIYNSNECNGSVAAAAAAAEPSI